MYIYIYVVPVYGPVPPPPDGMVPQAGYTPATPPPRWWSPRPPL